MIIELLGTRIIGPFYGVSLYVWSALISVALIALALGYFIGGYLADMKSAFKLSHVLSLSALFTALILLLSEPVLMVTDDLGIRGGAFASAVLIFTLPLTMLAMTGPFIITKTASTLHIVGSVSGAVYAVSTVGSVVGTLLLSLYLLPEFGSRSIINLLSIMLTLMSIAWAAYEAKSEQAFTWSTIPVAMFVAIVLLVAQYTRILGNDASFRELYTSESIYGRVKVVDDPENNYRWLMSDASTIGVASLITNNGLLQYQQTIKKMLNFNPNANDALLIGLGSGHLAIDLDRLGIITDSIEIDPDVTFAAQRFFGYKPKGNLIIGDARYHVRQMQKKYDLIIHDCFTGGTDPSHLLSREMFLDLQKRLKPGGILAVNMVGFIKGEQAKGTHAVQHTLKTVFRHNKAFITNTKTNFNDVTFFASSTPLTAHARNKNDRIEQWLKNHEFQFPDNDGLVITDNFNPMESIQVAKAELYRKYLIDRVGKKMLVW